MIKYELKKIFSKKTNKIVIAITILIAVILSFFASNSFVFVDEKGIEHRNFSSCRKLVDEKNKWKGLLNKEILTNVIDKKKELSKQYPKSIPNDIYAKELQSYWDIVGMINGVLKSDSEYDFNALLGLNSDSDIYEIREKNTNRLIDEYGKNDLQKKYFRKIYDKVKIPLYYEAYDSFETMFRYAGMFALILVLLVTIPVAGIFSDEFALKAYSVFYSSRFGKSKATKNKIITGFITASIIYFLGMFTLTVISFSILGISGYNVVRQFQYSYSIYNMTMLEEYLLIVLCGYIATLLSSSISMLMAAKTQKNGLSIFLPFLIFPVSPFIGRVLKIKEFFELTPDNLINIDNVVKVPNIYQIGTIIFKQVSFLTIFYFLLSLLMVPLIYKIFSNSYKRLY